MVFCLRGKPANARRQRAGRRFQGASNRDPGEVSARRHERPRVRAARRLDRERRSVTEQAPLKNPFRERDRARRAGIERHNRLRRHRRRSCRHHKINQREKRGLIFHVQLRRAGGQALQGLAAFTIAAGRWLPLHRLRLATVADGVGCHGPRCRLHQSDRAMIRGHQPRRHQHRDDECAQGRGVMAECFHDGAMNAEDRFAFKQSFAGWRRGGWKKTLSS